MPDPSSIPAGRTRRDVLLGLAACATVGATWRAMGMERAPADAIRAADGPAVGADGLRPFTWADALARSEINAAEVSIRGDVALVTTRPLGAPGTHFGNMRPEVTKRGEVWLCSSDLSACRRLELDARWLWAPLFSPGGTRLAMLATGGDGRVGLAVCDVGTGRVRLHDSVNVDIYGRMRTHGRDEQSPLGFTQSPLQFLWLDDDSLMFIASGQEQTQFELAGPSSSATYERLRSRAFDGEVSARIWSPQSEGCFIGRQLTRLELATGATSSLYVGDIRGASVSPDRTWAAILRAEERVATDADARQDAPLRFTSMADDPLVSCSLVCVRLADGASFEVPDFSAVGNAAPSRLPVWSFDSKRIAVVSRSSYSSAASTGDDACWEVQVDSRAMRRWAAASAADAEFMAALVAANDAGDVEAAVHARRPIEAPTMASAGQMRARSWVLAPGCVVKWNGNALHVVAGSDEQLLSDRCTAVAPPVPLSGGGHLVVAPLQDGRFAAVTLAAGDHSTRLVEMPKNATLLCAAADGRVLCKRDADDGSSIQVSAPGGPLVPSPFVLNRHLAEVRRASAREIVRSTPDGGTLTGILLTPTDRPAGGRAPVVLWAYPDSTPSLDGWMTRINDSTAVIYPFQHLLAQGFAVFQAPLPMAKRPDAADPLDYVADSIVPWLDVLDLEPDVAPGQYGFWGHSDAGYAALALQATTNRFKAIAAASTFPDLAATIYSAYLAIQPLDCAGYLMQANRFYYEAADQRYRVGGSLWRNAERFVRNSAVFRLEHAVTPMLLMVGEYDASPRSMEQVYSVLHGKGVPVELAYYWGEGHVIASPGNLHDLWTRSERFFRRHLPSG